MMQALGTFLLEGLAQLAEWNSFIVLILLHDPASRGRHSDSASESPTFYQTLLSISNHREVADRAA